MLVDKDFLRGITKLVEQANEVSRLCSDESVKWSTDDFLAVDIHDRYMSWKEDVDLFLQVHDLPLDAKFFRIENTVPLLKGGLEYGDKNSKESRGLIKVISLELDEKLKHLRELARQENTKVSKMNEVTKTTEQKQRIEIVVYGGTLIVDESTGFVKLNKVGDTLNLAGKEFKAILTLAKNDGHQATYTELIEGEDTKTQRRNLGFSIRNLKETLGILPKNESKNKDIIKNIKKYGYKLIT